MNSLPHNHDENIQVILESMPVDEKFSEAAEIFQQLGDGTRLKILWLISHSRECVSNIAAALGISKALASHHLQILRRSNLVDAVRVGKEIHYSLNNTDEAKLLHKTIDALFKITCPVDENN